MNLTRTFAKVVRMTDSRVRTVTYSTSLGFTRTEAIARTIRETSDTVMIHMGLLLSVQSTGLKTFTYPVCRQSSAGGSSIRLIASVFTELNRAGQDKFRQALPAGNVLDCNLVSVTIPESDAGPFYAWFDDMVPKGNPPAERGGLLEWLDPSGKPSLSVQLGGLGIVRYAPLPIRLDAGMKSPLVQVDMYCQTMNLLM